MAAMQLFFDFMDSPGSALKHVSDTKTVIPFPVLATTLSIKQTEQAAIPQGFVFISYGAWVNFGKRLVTSERLRINKKALALLDKPCEQLNSAELDTLRAYSGWGGLAAADERGVLYDYYTSPPIAALTWRLLNSIQPILKNAQILEPSCGTGVFFATGPQGVAYTGVELDERTAAIASRLHPDVSIISKSYEAFNISRDTIELFDHVIGNVPFGERTLETAFMDLKEEKSLDRYFLTRSLDNLKPGGTMALITHPGVLANSTNTAWRLSINRKAQFMGALKLNDDSFNHTHTGIQPDILFFRKHPEDIQRRLQTFSVYNMDQQELAQEDWINGTYFSAHSGHLMGTLQSGKGQWGADIVSGSVTPETLQAMLDTFTPETVFSDEIYDRIRQSIPLPEQTVKTSILPLTKDETDAVEDKRLSPGSVKTVDSAVYLLTSSYRWSIAVSDDSPLVERINRILAITREVKSIRNRMRKGQEAAALQKTVIAALNAYKDSYGDYPKADLFISRFLRNHPSVSGIYDAFIDPDSDILTLSNLYDTNGIPINGHNRAVAALLFLQQRMITANTETIRHYFPDETGELITEMYRNPDIFLSPDSAWQLREDFISGNAWDKIDGLTGLVEQETDTANRDKWQYGIAELEKAVGWIPIEEADFSPHSSWIPEEIINTWVGDEDGLDRSSLIRHGNLSRNETGKWGIRYRGDHARKETHDGQEFTVNYQKGQWAFLNDELIYYLNMQK
jgi:hypothetical protein